MPRRTPAGPILLAGLLLLATGCTPFGGRDGGGSLSRTPVDEAAFEEGQEAYLAGDYARAASRLGAYAGAHEGSAEGVEARYWQAMSLIGLGQTRRARLLLEEVQADASAGRELRALALRGVAQSRFAERDYRAAETAWRRLRSLYPNASSEEEVLAALAACRLRAGDPAGAERYRRQLAARHPESVYLDRPSEPGVANATGGRYSVQAGVFRSRVFADRLAGRLRRAGFEAIVTTRAGAYVVQAGAFAERANAERRAEALQRRGFSAVVKP